MAKEEKNEIAVCPNCQGPAIRQGNDITCEVCDATYTITKKDGAKVKELGRIEQIEQDVAALKAKVSGADPEPEPEPEPEPAADSEDGDNW